MDSSTLPTVRAGLHWSLRLQLRHIQRSSLPASAKVYGTEQGAHMSRQMAPLLLMLQWYTETHSAASVPARTSCSC